jgi:hypothetical protein
MSKRYDIKWRDKDVKELQRIVKNYNAKISYVEKRHPEKAEFLPEKITVKELMNDIQTRQDFKRETKSIKRFSNKGVENVITTPTGLSLTEYEINEARIKTRIVNQKRTAERKKLDIDVTRGNVGQIESQNLQPKKFSLNKSPKEWEKFVESLDKQVKANYKKESAEKYKLNYLKAIKDFLGEEGQALYDYVKKLDADVIYKNSVNDPLLSIGFTSDPLPANAIVEAALDKWQGVNE